MTEPNYNVIKSEHGLAIKAWTKGVLLEDAAEKQLLNLALLPFIHKWVAAIPAVDYGTDATVGSVIPTRRAMVLRRSAST
jgi:tRNA-splicing ligase RtcB